MDLVQIQIRTINCDKTVFRQRKIYYGLLDSTKKMMLTFVRGDNSIMIIWIQLGVS